MFYQMSYIITCKKCDKVLYDHTVITILKYLLFILNQTDRIMFSVFLRQTTYLAIVICIVI